MIAKLVVIFCAFQAALGQQVIVRDIRDMIDSTEQEMDNYISPLVTRMQAFSNGVLLESQRLETERLLLIQEIENLASLLNVNNVNNISDCLRISISDVNRIFSEREQALAAFNRISFSSFNQFITDIGYIVDEERNIVNETEDNIAACDTMVDLEAANSCYNEVFQLVDLMKDDILNRTMELYNLGRDALANAERTQMDFNDGNRQFLRSSAQVNRQAITSCIEAL